MEKRVVKLKVLIKSFGCEMENDRHDSDQAYDVVLLH